MPVIKKAEYVDVLLLCEGTFPYIKGGVSSWIYQLIKGLSEFSFGIIFLGGNSDDYKELAYDLPHNLIHLETHFLFEKISSKNQRKPIKGEKDLEQKMRNLHYWFRTHGDNLSEELKKLDFYKRIDHKQFLHSKKSFSFITSEYQKNCPDVPFIEYFWTVRNIHSPIWIIANAAMSVPKFSIVHSPSTGYAGLLGAFLKNNYGKKFILTEHGIYLMERKIDIALSSWIEEYRINLMKSSGEKNYIKELWIRLFNGINKFAYESADPIISLYSGARKIQLEYGANINKTMIIPNGINTEKFSKITKLRGDKISNIVALIGRVVSIKDIKTFITAIKIASEKIKDIEGWVVGPTEEDKEYYYECLELVKTLNLENKIKFKGFQKMEEILAQIGLLTLTSVSEGMPLVILEGFAAGIPAVATNVGACPELIYGKDEEDFKIGKAGEIIPTANPSSAAQAYVRILSDKAVWNQYSQNALKRVKTFYEEKNLLNKYRELYSSAIQEGKS
ncbi:MAG: GT4 family glycosyltransferase PelF [Elusimicrobia bacterium]|nr:GT4 family glycosyltransferase PelF [Elusimicrobiota bacterium]